MKRVEALGQSVERSDSELKFWQRLLWLLKQGDDRNLSEGTKRKERGQRRCQMEELSESVVCTRMMSV